MSTRVIVGWLKKRPLWQLALLAILPPILILNLSVAFFGKTVVFPLSPFYLKQKFGALARYAKHRTICLFKPHPALGPLASSATGRNHLPPGLLEAVLEVESHSMPHRISPAGAMGPAQLTAATAQTLGVGDPFDSAEAVDGAARYLAQQLKRFGDVRLAVAAYNAGPGGIVAARVPHNGETEHYVTRVMAEYYRRRPPQPLKKAQAMTPVIAPVMRMPVKNSKYGASSKRCAGLQREKLGKCRGAGAGSSNQGLEQQKNETRTGNGRSKDGSDREQRRE